MGEQDFDLVILGLNNRPDLASHAVMKHIRALAEPAQLLVVSASAEIDAAICSFRHGACDFLRKPFSRELLLRTVDAALHERRHNAEDRRSAARLQDSEMAYRYLVESSRDIIYTLDEDGRFTFINERAQQLLGYTRDEMLGKQLHEIVHEDDKELAHHTLATGPDAAPQPRHIELRLMPRGADGVPMTFAVTLSSISATQPEAKLGLTSNRATPARMHGVARDISHRKTARSLIHHQACHDHLTGLPNRALFNDRLGLAMRHADDNACGVAVLFLDLDRFKRINDTLGHAAGDELLQQVAQRLTACLRSGDTLSRYGGDEFTVVLPALKTPADAGHIASKLVNCVRPLFRVAGFPVKVSASVGIATYLRGSETEEELIANADVAMYHVKVNGKNGHAFFAPEMPRTRLP
jgi:diguanylate cyclase (GGDEF)-like protein/PAS domain S-box-containing protein